MLEEKLLLLKRTATKKGGEMHCHTLNASSAAKKNIGQTNHQTTIFAMTAF
jgi:hypothetical protein